ncbi:hypothetical protein [Campylobacter concisus]|jgi:hypothetical protein|uniref:hypothetical protein n=1 Tax=Campylobacter concisus TaxID=199 RepID=UPI00131CFFD7|nr:hypothetical protein [Campylobacter concisus]
MEKNKNRDFDISILAGLEKSNSSVGVATLLVMGIILIMILKDVALGNLYVGALWGFLLPFFIISSVLIVKICKKTY